MGQSDADGATGCNRVGSEGLPQSQAREAVCRPMTEQTLDPGDLVPVFNLALTSCVILDKVLHFSEPQFPHPQNGDDNGASLLVSG